MYFVREIPGKVILCGGYLVTKEPNSCLIVVPKNMSKIQVKRFPADKPRIKIYTNFSDQAIFFYDSIFYSETKLSSAMSYSLQIINFFYKDSNYLPKDELVIQIDLSHDLFSIIADNLEDSVKTGLGSSAVFLIGIVDVLLPYKIPAEEYLGICIRINNLLCSNSSCCDIFSCIFGNMVYTKYKYKTVTIDDKFAMVLGSFNTSTNTRDMIKNFDGKGSWEELNLLNEKIIAQFSDDNMDVLKVKSKFKEYLNKLREISSVIVPDRQYKILINTFEEDILGCGVSGSGGEDCAWCLVATNKLDEVLSLWYKEFTYVSVLKDLNGKSVLKNLAL